MCGITHKSPIAIDPHSGMFFFPTTSPNNPTCAWIAHSHIFQIKPLDKDKTKIIFKTGQEIIVSVSYGSMMNQIQRTAQFRYKLTERLHYTWNGDHEKVAEPFI
ncbi:competence protein ComK [Salinibacillus kushneri]|uniref:Competence protein ComK n=1 Tax=Salinibacillus kushneri TaxID=237682 RepID=A0A1I0J2P2_9BACI|nr:competence protein ComK [Salinibacillus kushneri]